MQHVSIKHGPVRKQRPNGPDPDPEIRDMVLVRKGYTVISGDQCMARIGADYVMQDSFGHCVRIPAAMVGLTALGAAWVAFCRPPAGVDVGPDDFDPTWNLSGGLRDAGLVMQGFIVTTDDLCLARVGMDYVMRDGHGRYTRIPGDTVSLELLGAAWTAFGCKVRLEMVTPAGCASVPAGPVFNRPVSPRNDQIFCVV